MLIFRARYNWPRQAGDCISDPMTRNYSFFHFPTPVQIRVNGELIHTRPNACILTEPGQPRWFFFPEDTAINWLHAFPEIKPLLEECQIPRNCVFYPEETGFIPGAFCEMMLEYLSDEPFRDDLLDSYGKAFFIKLSRALRTDAAQLAIRAADRKKLRELRQEVFSKPEKAWTVANMAEYVSLSPSRFHAVYRTLFGISPMKDVINARVECAKGLLTTDAHATLSAIAEKLGYKNQYHFIRQFRTATGITPGEYRKNKN